MKKMLCVITLCFSQSFYGANGAKRLREEQNFQQQDRIPQLNRLRGLGLIPDENGCVNIPFEDGIIKLHVYDPESNTINYADVETFYRILELQNQELQNNE